MPEVNSQDVTKIDRQTKQKLSLSHKNKKMNAEKAGN
jgi:hypothetical protein